MIIHVPAKVDPKNRENCNLCPVAEAIAKAFGLELRERWPGGGGWQYCVPNTGIYIAVDEHTLHFRGRRGKDGTPRLVEIELPKKVTERIRDYDKTGVMKEFSFRFAGKKFKRAAGIK